MTDFASMLQKPANGWPCTGCGERIDWPGVCDRCADAMARERAKDMAQDAISTIPSRFRWATFEAQELEARAGCVDAARKAGRGLVRGNVRGILLVGLAGSGKTTLACALMRGMLTLPIGRTAKFAGALTLSRARADSGLGRTPALVDDAIRASLLVLDDLGQELHDDVIREVVHARHDADRPIIVTTGTPIDRFSDRYGAGTARRLTEGVQLVEVVR